MNIIGHPEALLSVIVMERPEEITRMTARPEALQ